MPRVTESAEDYLERIHELIDGKGYARVADIAKTLGVKQASVTRMVQRLSVQGFLAYEKYRGLTLTRKGRKVALAVKRRHKAIEQFMRILGVDDATRAREIEDIEHHLSGETIRRLEELVELLKENPRLVKRLREGRAV
jgi:Mn-dependent DtxR family transcriptional regulator